MRSFLQMLCITWFFGLGLLVPFKSHSQCCVQDSSALVEFYWAANGPTWYNDANWLTSPVEDWYGVALGTGSISDRVRELSLVNNNLSGTISPLLSNLTELRLLILDGYNLTAVIPQYLGNTKLNHLSLFNNYLTNPIPLSLGNYSSNHINHLDLSNNEFSGVFPDTIIRSPYLVILRLRNNHFTQIGHEYPLTVWLENNRFTFKDIIYYKNLFPTNIVSPQDSLYGTWDTTILVGSTFVMDAWADTCSGNRYTWYKNGNWLNWDNPNSWMTINNAQVSHSGTYICRVSNPSQCSGVYLYRKAIHLTVSPTAHIDPQPIPKKQCIVIYRMGEQMLDISYGFDRNTRVEAGIYDECGRKVLRLFEGETANQEMHHYLGWMKKGLYIVRVKTHSGIITYKIII